MQIRNIDDIKNIMLEAKDRVIELYNSITGSVLTDPELTQLTSPSAASVWRLWVFIVSVCIWVHEYLWGVFRQEVDEVAANAVPNTARWLRAQLYKFQYGHDLLFNNYIPYYATQDPDARIISQAAVVETTTGLVLVKVAKRASGGLLEALTSLEVQAVEQYIDDIKPAGTITQALSLNADKIKVLAEVYYDPLFVLGAVKANTEAAIVGCLQNLAFNGRLHLSKLQDAIQAVPGVTDVNLSYVGAQVGTNPYTQITNAVYPAAPTYQAVAGYCDIDPAFPLANTITYIPSA